MKKLLVLMCLICCALNAHNAQAKAAPIKKDFAYGLPIVAESEAPIYEINLPAAVYRHAARPDLGDIRVFNSKNELVPHAVSRPRMPSKPHPAMEIPIFPIPGQNVRNDQNVSLNIATDETGTIIDVQTDGPAKKTEKTSAWLLDLSGLRDLRPEKLVLEWEDRPKNFTATVSLSGSHDLASWQPLVQAASVAAIQFSGHRLFKNTIVLPGTTMPYLRLNWPQSPTTPTLTTVTAHFPERPRAHPRQWKRLDAKKSKKAGAWTYDSSGAFPVDRLDLELPEGNQLMQAIIQSRQSRQDEWHSRHRGLFYRLRTDGTTLSNAPTMLPPASERFWQVKLVSDESAISEAPPRLRLGWLPHRLVFLARDNPPFTLAFGSGDIPPAAETVDLLLSEFKTRSSSGLIKPASTGEMVVLGGPERLEPAPPPLPWKKWLLWAVLISSVLALAAMAIRLYRQM